MLCPNCQQEIENSARFCPYCSTRISVQQSRQDQTVAIPPFQNPFAAKPSVAETTGVDEENFGTSVPELNLENASGAIGEGKFQQLNSIINGSSDVREAWQSYDNCENDMLSTSLPGGGIPGSKRSQNRRNATEYEIPEESWLAPLPVRIEYAVNRYIVSSWGGGGMEDNAKQPVNLEIRLFEKEEPLKAVQAWVTINAGREKEVCFFGRSWTHLGMSWSNILPYDLKWALKGGELLMDYFLLCQFEDRIEYFTFNVKHAVISSGQTGKQIVNNFNVTAGDGSVIKEVDLNSMDNNGAAFIESLNANEPCFVPMAFRRTEDWRPEDFLVDGRGEYMRYACDKITLEYGNLMLRLCAKDEIRLGRSFSQNDIAINDWTNEQTFFDAPSITVSHCHGKIKYLGNKVAYKDTSSYGTLIRVGTAKYMIHRETELSQCKVPDICQIGFGSVQMDVEIVSCEARKRDASCINCLQKKCRAMIMRRRDNLPEVFLFVWQCCQLDSVVPELAGLTVYRRNGGFMLQTGDGQLLTLAPKMKIKLQNGKSLKVSKFFQPIY